MTKHSITTVMSVLYDENDASTYPLKKVSIVLKSLEYGESTIEMTPTESELVPNWKAWSHNL